MRHLTELLSRDLSAVDPAEVFEGMRQAELLHDATPDWTGRMAAAMSRRGFSWSEIAHAAGIAQTTVYRRAQPYL